MGCRETDHTEHQKDNGTYADTEPAGFLHTVIKPSAEAVAANRLEALTKAYDNGVDKEHKAADNGHGCKWLPSQVRLAQLKVKGWLATLAIP